MNPGTFLSCVKTTHILNRRHMSSTQADVSVVFRGLPPDPIYTLGMDVAQSWLTRPYESPHDLDNIHLAALSPAEQANGVEAVFDLDFLVIEGHAREPSNAPPRGVQLQLTSIGSTALIADTLVMANLGYLQFRAKPGVFQLGIRPGRGREVFEMESVGNQGWDSPTIREAGDVVTLTSFEGLTLYPRLRRRVGMEAAEVLEHTESIQSVENVLKAGYSWYVSYYCRKPCSTAQHDVSRVKSYFNPTKGKEVSTRVQADINIFTVASGLLYEVRRVLRDPTILH
jgi:UDP-glucose:glycoprotein glucosyltransferase